MMMMMMAVIHAEPLPKIRLTLDLDVELYERRASFLARIPCLIQHTVYSTVQHERDAVNVSQSE